MPAVIASATAEILHDGDTGTPAAAVALTLEKGTQVTLLIHPSLVFTGTLNLEIDGDFTTDTALRIHLNDHLIWDTTRNDPALPDERPGDLPDDPDDRDAPRG